MGWFLVNLAIGYFKSIKMIWMHISSINCFRYKTNEVPFTFLLLDFAPVSFSWCTQRHLRAAVFESCLFNLMITFRWRLQISFLSRTCHWDIVQGFCDPLEVGSPDLSVVSPGGKSVPFLNFLDIVYWGYFLWGYWGDQDHVIYSIWPWGPHKFL